MTSSCLIPVYRGLTIVGTVLTCDEEGEARHALVMDTTLLQEVEVVYELA